MSHEIFENWLLESRPLSDEEHHRLHTHLQECAQCRALAKVNRLLHSATLAAPRPGFDQRFARRLAAYRQREQRQRYGGYLILTLAGTGTLAWMLALYVGRFLGSPATGLASLILSVFSLLNLLDFLSHLGPILFRLAFALLPASLPSAVGMALGGAILIGLLELKHFVRQRKELKT